MMKITMLITNLSKGGAQGVFVTIANYLKTKGYEIEIIVQNLDDSVHKDNLEKEIPIINLKVDSAKKLLFPLCKYIKNHQIQYALVFSPEMAVNLYWTKLLERKQFPICARCMNTLSVEYRHTDSIFRKYVTHYSLKLFYHKVDRVIAQSKQMGNDLIENYGFRDNQVTVINNSLASKFEKELLEKTVCKKERYILYAGRLEKQKGLEMLLEAVSAMRNKDVALLIIGNGSLKDELQIKAKKLDISSKVKFIEYTADMVSYYKNALVTVLSSYYEGFPNVLIESLSCGTPVVSYDMPSGPREIIIEGINGYLVEYLNVKELTEKIDNAVETEWNYDEVKKTAMKYKQEVIVEKYVNIIRKMTE